MATRPVACCETLAYNGGSVGAIPPVATKHNTRGYIRTTPTSDTRQQTDRHEVRDVCRDQLNAIQTANKMVGKRHIE